MINNRQGGRRRGRGGQRPQNVPGRVDNNRQDNRQRGNAAQLLEKYKSLARDSQLAGDRVQTEYYLQFADHYFRVLGESRARFEEQRRQRGERDDGGEDDELDDEMMDAGDEDRQSEPQRRFTAESDSDDEEGYQPAPRQERAARQPREERQPRRDRGERNGARPALHANGGHAEVNRERANGDERIAFDVLPPSIGPEPIQDNQPADEGEEAPRPRRRARRPRVQEGGEEIAPAA